MKKLSLKEIYFLNELNRVDEPEGGPFGKVLFAPERMDKVKEEPNTPLEDEFLSSLGYHLTSDMDRNLARIAPLILKIIRQKKYEKLLKPPGGYVYRFLNNVPLQVASKILGLNEEELLEESGKAWYVETNAKLKPKEGNRGRIQSWTIKPSVNALMLTPSYGSLGTSEVAMLLEADIQAGRNKFFINPILFSKLKGGFEEFVDEKETISYGPVKLSGASFFVNPPGKIIKMSVIFPSLLRALGK